MRATWTCRIVALSSAALLLPLAFPLVAGRVFVMNDLGNFHLPLRFLYQSALRGGDSVLWTPSLFAGFYLHAEGQLGMFHPLHLALYWLFPLGVAFNLDFLSSYVLAFAGMYWFLRRMELRAAGALFGAMLFTFCGFHLLHFIHMNVVAITAEIPWLLGSIDVLLTADTPRGRAAGVLAIALVLSSEVLLGFPQAVWWNVLTGATFGLARAAQLRRWRPLVFALLASLVAPLIGALQLLPTADLAASSNRALLPRDFALTYSLHPLNVLQLWSPYVFSNRFFVTRVYDSADYPWVHELGVYCGATALVALAWLWIRRDALRAQRRLIVWASLFAVLTSILTLGRFGGLDVLLTYVPGVGSFRAPVRYIVLVQFSLAVLSAIAFDDLTDRGRAPVRLTGRDRAVLLVPLVLAALTTVLVNGHVVFVPGAQSARLSTAAAGIVPLAAVTTMFAIAARGRGWPVVLLVLVTAADLGIWGIGYVYHEPPRTIAQFVGAWPVAAPRTRVDCAFNCDDRIVLRGYDLVEPYVALYPLTEVPIYTEQFQQLAGVSLELLESGSLEARPGGVPRARLLTDVRASDDIAGDLWDVDLHRTALVTRELPPLGGTAGSARVLVDRPGRIAVETSTAGRQLLSISERYHPGWRAAVDGVSVPSVAVNGDFLGCVVEAGTHHVEFAFRPRSFVAGAAVSVAGVVALAALLALAASPKGMRL